MSTEFLPRRPFFAEKNSRHDFRHEELLELAFLLSKLKAESELSLQEQVFLWDLADLEKKLGAPDLFTAAEWLLN